MSETFESTRLNRLAHFRAKRMASLLIISVRCCNQLDRGLKETM